MVYRRRLIFCRKIRRILGEYNNIQRDRCFLRLSFITSFPPRFRLREEERRRKEISRRIVGSSMGFTLYTDVIASRKLRIASFGRTSLSSFESVLLPLVEEVGFGTSEVDDLRTTVSVFFLDRALLAVVGVGNTRPAADHASSLVRAVVALVADSHQSARSHVGVAYDAFAVALLAKSPDRNTGLLPTEDQIRMMLCHILMRGKFSWASGRLD